MNEKELIAFSIGKKKGGGGGSATLISKNITENGVYNASGDNADGYSSVAVNVPDNLVAICNKTATELVSTEIINVPSFLCASNNNLTTVNLPNAVTLGDRAFQFCQYLTSAVFSENATAIPTAFLYNCSRLASFNIPSEVRTIGNEAFRGCGFPVLTFPAKVTDIGAQQYFGTSQGLATIIMLPSTPPTIKTNTFFLSSGCRIIVPYSADHSILNAYKTATNWAAIADYIEEAAE